MSRTEAGVGGLGEARRMPKKLQEKFLDRLLLGAGEETCYLIFSTHGRGLWA